MWISQFVYLVDPFFCEAYKKGDVGSNTTYKLLENQRPLKKLGLLCSGSPSVSKIVATARWPGTTV
jgi:hypothetical protein